MIELSGHFYIRLSEDEIRAAGGSYWQAVQNEIGSTGMDVDEVADEWDNPTLQHREAGDDT